MSKKSASKEEKPITQTPLIDTEQITRWLRVKKHILLFRKRYSFGFVASLVIIIAIILYFVISSQVHLVLNNEVVIVHSPRLNYSEYERNSSFTISVDVDIDTFDRCKSTCDSSLINLISNESVNVNHLGNTLLQGRFETPGKGSGHFFVQAKTSCVAAKSFFCPSTGRPIIESSLYSVLYTLTDEEQSIVTNQIFEQIENDLLEAKTLQENTAVPFQTINLSQIESKLRESNSYWESQDYVQAMKSLPQSNFLDSVKTDYDTYTQAVLNYTLLRNSLIDLQTNFTLYLDLYNQTPSLFAQLASIENQQNINAQTFTTNTLLAYSYEQILKTLSQLQTQNELILAEAINTYLSQPITNTSNMTLVSNPTCDTVAVSNNFNCERVSYNPQQLISITVSNQTNQSTAPFGFFSEPTLICCHLGDCTACTQTHTPILFIHGHAFSKDNTPENQMSSFAILQDELPYINGGIVDLQTAYTLPRGAYDKSVYPITFRGTYYYIDSYDVGDYSLNIQKSERIENYALRLRELVESVKHLTNSDKVIIVAHSMGGLVAREYVNIFGSNSVEKIITINTPHQGIVDRTKKTCSLFGAKKECEDMEKGSVFMRRIATVQDVYIIRSTGCEMGDVIGDGIVTDENGQLPNAKTDIVIEGNCTDTLQTSLHSDVLNPQLYPEIVPKLKLLIES